MTGTEEFWVIKFSKRTHRDYFLRCCFLQGHKTLASQHGIESRTVGLSKIPRCCTHFVVIDLAQSSMRMDRSKRKKD